MGYPMSNGYRRGGATAIPFAGPDAGLSNEAARIGRQMLDDLLSPQPPQKVKDAYKRILQYLPYLKAARYVVGNIEFNYGNAAPDFSGYDHWCGPRIIPGGQKYSLEGYNAIPGIPSCVGLGSTGSPLGNNVMPEGIVRVVRFEGPITFGRGQYEGWRRKAGATGPFPTGRYRVGRIDLPQPWGEPWDLPITRPQREYEPAPWEAIPYIPNPWDDPSPIPKPARRVAPSFPTPWPGPLPSPSPSRPGPSTRPRPTFPSRPGTRPRPVGDPPTLPRVVPDVQPKPRPVDPTPEPEPKPDVKPPTPEPRPRTFPVGAFSRAPRKTKEVLAEPRIQLLKDTVHRLKPPGPRTKEVKPVGGLARAVWLMMNVATEVRDVIKSFWKALPKRCKSKTTTKGPAFSKFAARNAPTVQRMFWDVYECMQGESAKSMNDAETAKWLNDSVDNLIMDEIKDRGFGRLGKALAKESAKTGRPIGLQAGPAL